MSGDFEGNAAELIPADVRMISGCQDAQTSADVSNVSEFQLPDPAGRSGGACTSALLKVLYNEHHKNDENLSFVQVLTRMRQILGQGSYTQIPQLSASRKMDVNESFQIVPKGCTGTKRALLIGINYVGQQGQLSGCHNDVGNIKDYLVNAQGFSESNVIVLMDDGQHQSPTYANMIAAFRNLVSSTESGDCAFFHYSGHGGRIADENNDENDGYDETLIPVDYQSAGQMRDDTIFSELVGRMPQGSTLTCLMDCCHSGSVLDLPYTFKADGQQQEMGQNPNANLNQLKTMAIKYLIKKVFGTGAVAQIVLTIVNNVSTGGGSGGGGGGANMSLGFLNSLFSLVCR
ncbi:Caspase domain [Fragilaria crotonensis]|nr:Caspase domain [Fragilaria crotonensis]